MIGCLLTRVRKQPIIALYVELETVLKFHNLEASFKLITHKCLSSIASMIFYIGFPLTVKVASLIYIPGRGSAISSAKVLFIIR